MALSCGQQPKDPCRDNLRPNVQLRRLIRLCYRTSILWNQQNSGRNWFRGTLQRCRISYLNGLALNLQAWRLFLYNRTTGPYRLATTARSSNRHTACTKTIRTDIWLSTRARIQRFSSVKDTQYMARVQAQSESDLVRWVYMLTTPQQLF